MSNHKEMYSYYCQDEAKFISEEREKGSVPTQCVNNVAHTITPDSVHISAGDYCNYTDDATIPEEFDLTTLNYASLSANEKKIVELLRSLLICAKHRGLINM